MRSHPARIGVQAFARLNILTSKTQQGISRSAYRDCSGDETAIPLSLRHIGTHS